MNSHSGEQSGGSRRRVVVTGMGVVAANGKDLDSFWESVCRGASAAGGVTRFDVSQSPTRIAAEVGDFDPARYMDHKTARRLDRSLQFSVAAARLAMRDAGLEGAGGDPDRIGVVEGTSLSNNETAARTDEVFRRRGYRGVSPLALINGYCGGGSGEIALELNCRGHSITCSSGSASGNDAIGYALNLIRADEADVMVAGGAEAPILPQIWGVFCQSKVMTRRNEEPGRAMRPFDRHRDGFLLGEGGAFLVLEELSHALQRGARVYAEVTGHGRSCEAYHPVAPEPQGAGVQRCIEKALRNASLDVEEVDYINMHGTATEASDLVETRAIKRLFGYAASRLSVSSTKPVTGHLLAASGSLEAVICTLALHRQEIPPTINLDEPDGECDLDYVREGARRYPLRTTLNLSSGFGGKNSCLALSRYPHS